MSSSRRWRPARWLNASSSPARIAAVSAVDSTDPDGIRVPLTVPLPVGADAVGDAQSVIPESSAEIIGVRRPLANSCRWRQLSRVASSDRSPMLASIRGPDVSRNDTNRGRGNIPDRYEETAPCQLAALDPRPL